MRFTAVVTHEPPWYVARCAEVEAAAQGATAEDATENLRDALAASGGAVAARERAVVVEIEVPVGEATDERAQRGFDRRAIVRHLVAAGWAVVPHAHHDVLRGPDGTRVAALPHGIEMVAPGVFRFLLAPTPADLPADDGAGDAFERLDALFARHPRDGDATTAVREMRDDRGGASSKTRTSS